MGLNFLRHFYRLVRVVVAVLDKRDVVGELGVTCVGVLLRSFGILVGDMDGRLLTYINQIFVKRHH